MEFANKAMATVNAAVRPFARDDDDAEDMAQGAWLRIIEKLPRLVRDDNIAGWCATVAKNYCKSVLREARRATGAGLALLPKQERRAVRLRILQGRTSTQTAKTLRVAVPTARALVRRGLPVLAFLASSRHRREARFAIASGEDVFGAMVFADNLKTVERLSRRHPGSLVLVDSGEQLTEASERRKDIAIVQWRRAYKNADVLLPALVRAIVAKPVAALVSGRLCARLHVPPFKAVAAPAT